MASSSAKALSEGIRLLPKTISVSMASSSAKALSVGVEGDKLLRLGFQWPPHRPRHCRKVFKDACERRFKFQWPPHRPRHCRQDGHRLGSDQRVPMASSSAKALSVVDWRQRCRHRHRFNGLLIGQGTVGATPGTAARQWVRTFQWPPHRPRHCRPLPGVVPAIRDRVSITSSSAKALSGCRDWLSRCRKTFQWPPHRPRHCRAKSFTLRVRRQKRFQWPPHRPRHCRSRSGQCERRGKVSMASSSAKALSASTLPSRRTFSRFNGLLIGQGTVGPNSRQSTQRVPTVSMASSSAKALSV